MSEPTDPTAGERDGWDPDNPRRWIGQCSTPEPCPDNGMGYRFHGADCRWRGVTPTPAEPDAGDVEAVDIVTLREGMLGLVWSCTCGATGAGYRPPVRAAADKHSRMHLAARLDAVRRKAGDDAVRSLVADLRELATDLEENVDWSPGRDNYGDNEAWETAGKRLRAALPGEQ